MIKFLKYSFLSILSGVVILPLVFTFMNAFMGIEELFYYYGDLNTGNEVYLAFHLLPDRWSLDGFVKILLTTPDYLMKFWNSIGITAAVAAGQILLSVLAGYAFSKFQFPGRKPLFMLIILVMMMPYQVTLVSNYIILDKLHLIGSYTAVILPGIFSSFGVFLMKQVMDEVPHELLDAAQLDGANSMRILLSILLPLCKGGMAALLILNFIDNWNMVEQPIVFLKDASMYPLSVFLAEAISASSMEIFAAQLLVLAPVLLLFANFRKEMIHGIVESGVKEV